MKSNNLKTPLIRRPWFAFLSSMRFAVALLSLLGVASIIGELVREARSREERLYWLQMNDDQKHQVMRLIFARRKKLQQMAWERQSGVEIELPEQESFEF